jgi:hypothetical protein
MLSLMSGGKGDQDRIEPPDNADALISAMGRERMALRARKTTVALLRIASFVCLGVVALSLTGYAPYALAPILMLIATGAVGLILSVVERPRP